jgi:Do/DeqQ family serine protease
MMDGWYGQRGLKMASLLRTISLLSLISGALGQNANVSTDVVVPQDMPQVKLSFAPTVKKTAPAVVNIYATSVMKAQGFSMLADDPVLKQFFGDLFPRQGQDRASRVQSSLGSGVIVRPDGIVITNYHVIKHAEKIRVVLIDGREFEAEVVVKDTKTDLVALRLKTSEKDLPYLTFKNSDEVEVGDIVLAVGNPFGLGHTVTMGIISGLSRSQFGMQDYRSYIQTDASINPGNSGGALIGLDGRIVAINTFILSQSGGSIGIGFAIPSSLVLPVLASVDKGDGKVRRPWVGLEVKTLGPDVAKTMLLETKGGVVVQQVFEKSAAQKAGFKEGDIIVKVDGQPVLTEGSYRFRIAGAQVGSKATFTVVRQGQTVDVSVDLEPAPDMLDNRQAEIQGRNPLAGAIVTGLSPAIAEEMGINYQSKGVIILAIRPGSISNLSGLLPGDILTKVNGMNIVTVEDLQRSLGRSKRGWEMTVQRGTETMQLTMQGW